MISVNIGVVFARDAFIVIGGSRVINVITEKMISRLMVCVHPYTLRLLVWYSKVIIWCTWISGDDRNVEIIGTTLKKPVVCIREGFGRFDGGSRPLATT